LGALCATKAAATAWNLSFSLLETYLAVTQRRTNNSRQARLSAWRDLLNDSVKEE